MEVVTSLLNQESAKYDYISYPDWMRLFLFNQGVHVLDFNVKQAMPSPFRGSGRSRGRGGSRKRKTSGRSVSGRSAGSSKSRSGSHNTSSNLSNPSRIVSQGYGNRDGSTIVMPAGVVSGEGACTHDASNRVNIGTSDGEMVMDEMTEMRSLFGSIALSDEILMAIDIRDKSTLGCAYYVSREEKLYLMQDCKLGDNAILDSCKPDHEERVSLLNQNQCFCISSLPLYCFQPG